MKSPRLALLIFSVGLISLTAWADIIPLKDSIPCVIQDRQAAQVPDRVRLTGYLGQRILGNEAQRLAQIDTDRLLEGYRKRPGRQAWDGEHVGKWLHAATLAWVNTGDAALRAKLDYTVRELMKCQLDDGYLGTYAAKDRWTEWDVWAHKYNLIGLLTYMRYTGDTAPLATCRRMADLLCSQLGDKPGQLDIIKAGSQHVGMASTSVLEPMVLLYRFTGETRYLEFCQMILRAWEEPQGPHILSVLVAGGGVNQVGNAKAYEMLSCLNGAVELYRTTGDVNLLKACLNAWQDIVNKRLYITGTASAREYFHGDDELDRANNTAETCVTVTWLQLNAQLLRLTGEARFAEQLEKTVLNQLLGAQSPDCRAWGYYVEMEGTKPYSDTLDGHCCLSSGPRGIALIPTFAVTTDSEGIVFNLYDSGSAELRLREGGQVSVITQTRYPQGEYIDIRVDPDREGVFTVKLRIPAWTQLAAVGVNNQERQKVTAGDYAKLTRTWKKGDIIHLAVANTPRMIVGTHGDKGRVAVCFGPLVMALDEASIRDAGLRRQTVCLPLGATPGSAWSAITSESEALMTASLELPCKVLARVGTPRVEYLGETIAKWRPFAEVGAKGDAYQVWVKQLTPEDENLLPYGEASCSDSKADAKLVIDEAPKTAAIATADSPGTECWFAVRLQRPARLQRFVYRSGYGTWYEGGRYVLPAWFDGSHGKPRIEIRRTPGAAWESVGEFSGYPSTTRSDGSGVQEGTRFELTLDRSVVAVEVRLIGLPSMPKGASKAAASCAELEAWGAAD